MASVRITRQADGMFAWPDDLPELVAAVPSTVAANILAHGTGAINIEACRVASDPRPVMVRTDTVVAARAMAGKSTGATASGEMTTAGRWPPNLILGHSPTCGDGACAEGCPVAELDRQSGAVGQLEPQLTGNEPSSAETGTVTGPRNRVKQAVRHADVGGASRFFPTFSWDPEIDVPFMYCAKAAKRERNAAGENKHPTVKPVKLMEWLCKLVTPPDGLILDPFLGAEREAEYFEIASARIRKAYADWKAERK
jgi:hypothetical protein